MNQAEFLKNFIDSSEAKMYLKDDEGRFLMVNRSVAEMIGASQEDIIGKTDYDFFSSEDSDKFRKNDLQVAEAGIPMTFKATAVFADGPHTLIDHKFPVSGIDGSPNAVGGVAIDITESE